MKSIKAFDLFEKITTNDIVQPTLSGALVSLTGVAIIILLLLQEIVSYLTPDIKKETIILNDRTGFDKIKMNFSVKFYHMTCPLISVDQEDLVGSHQLDIKTNLEKIRFDQTGQKILGTFLPYHTAQLEKAINDYESCFVRGYVEINKVPGNVHFSFHNYRNAWEYLKDRRQEIYEKIDFSHKIFRISFGDNLVNDKLVKKFGLDEKSFQGSSLPDFNGDKKNGKNNYDYYLKLIPHIFIDEYTGEEMYSYEYSTSSKSRQLENSEEMPIVVINYDISPITMRVTILKKSISKFIIHICAIVGGVFAIFSILNRVLIFLFIDNISEKEKEKCNKN